MDDAFAVLLIPVTLLVGGFVLAALAMQRRTRLGELAYRERIAMIEKGLIPSPETDPARFEAVVGRSPGTPEVDRTALARARRRRDAGVILTGFGLGLGILMFGTVGDLGVAAGVGGGFAMLGAAFVVGGLLMIRDAEQTRAPADTYGAPPSQPPVS